MARILEDGLIERPVQVGIPGPSSEQADVARRWGVEAYPAFHLARLDRPEFSSPLRVSIDIDGLDPAFAPGVSHPEPGSLTVRRVLDLIAGTRAPRIVGPDVVEVN